MTDKTKASVGHSPGRATRASRRSLGLAGEEWLGISHGHEIRVQTRGVLAARLYVDGVLCDRRSPLFSTDPDVPLLSARLPLRTEVIIVHVFAKGMFAGRIEVRIGRKPIAMYRRAQADRVTEGH